MAEPKRRCVVCRKSAPKRELLRFVAGIEGLERDELAVRPGRGAYVHPSLECCSKMNEPGRFEYALKLKPGAIKRESLAVLAKEMCLRAGRAE